MILFFFKVPKFIVKKTKMGASTSMFAVMERQSGVIVREHPALTNKLLTRVKTDPKLASLYPNREEVEQQNLANEVNALYNNIVFNAEARDCYKNLWLAGDEDLMELDKVMEKMSGAEEMKEYLKDESL